MQAVQDHNTVPHRDKNHDQKADVIPLQLWTLATFFVVPLLVIEQKRPWEAIKESGTMLKETWGEHLISNFSFGLVFFVLAIPGYLIIFLGVITGTKLAGIAIVAGVIYMILLALISSALETVFKTALFRYARYGYVDGEFTEDMLMLSYTKTSEY